MSTKNEFLTLVDFSDLQTELVTFQQDQYLAGNFEYVYKSYLFGEIPTIHDLVIMSVLTVIGMAFSTLILRIYWSVKNNIVAYIKALAVFDMFTIVYLAILRPVQIFCGPEVVGAYNIGFTVIANHMILGSLFLALDRFLIVAFPHKFKLYKTKMRIFKIVIFAETLFSSLGWFLPGSLLIYFIALASVNLVLQFLACIGLYTFIVVRVILSERQMTKHRHVGNG